jgi:hypothetical protein
MARLCFFEGFVLVILFLGHFSDENPLDSPPFTHRFKILF